MSFHPLIKDEAQQGLLYQILHSLLVQGLLDIFRQILHCKRGSMEQMTLVFVSGPKVTIKNVLFSKY